MACTSSSSPRVVRALTDDDLHAADELTLFSFSRGFFFVDGVDDAAVVVADSPRFLEGWAELGDLGRDTIERYAAYRVGYHRGLDTLRASGWRGSGYLRWSEPTNRGFLRSLRGLGAMAAEIGENDEAERCALFLLQLDPSGDAGR